MYNKVTLVNKYYIDGIMKTIDLIGSSNVKYTGLEWEIVKLNEGYKYLIIQLRKQLKFLQLFNNNCNIKSYFFKFRLCCKTSTNNQCRKLKNHACWNIINLLSF